MRKIPRSNGQEEETDVRIRRSKEFEYLPPIKERMEDPKEDQDTGETDGCDELWPLSRSDLG